MKKILLLGADSYVGKKVVDILKEHIQEFELVGISIDNDLSYLNELLNIFNLRYIYSYNLDERILSMFPNIKFYSGKMGLEKLVMEHDYDVLVNCLTGIVGIKPTLLAIGNKKDVVLSNRETLVCAGDIITKAANTYNVNLIPISPKHTSILQTLRGHSVSEIDSIYLTNKGIFSSETKDSLANLSLKALSQMNGSLVNIIDTINNINLIDSCFDMIEAHYLFNIDYERIDAVIHSSNKTNALIKYVDGSIISSFANNSLNNSIKYALFYPHHIYDKYVINNDIYSLSNIDYKEVDYVRYPLFKIVKQLANFGGNFGSIFIGAIEQANKLFLENKINFYRIEELIINTLRNAHFIQNPTLDEIIESNIWAKNFINDIVNNGR